VARRAFLRTLVSRLFDPPLAAEVQPVRERPCIGAGSATSLVSVACRPRIAIMGLATFGCVTRPRPDDRFLTFGVFFTGIVVFLICTGTLLFLSSRRRRRKLAKIFVALVGAAVCGVLWILLVDTVLSATISGAMDALAMFLLGAVTMALVATGLLLRPSRLRELVGLSAIVIGFHALALPMAVLVAMFLRGAPWSPAASIRSALIAVILRIRSAADLPTIGLSVGGLLLGVFLVFVGERVLSRRPRRRSVPMRFDLNRPYG